MRLVAMILCLLLTSHSGYCGIKRATGYGVTMESGKSNRLIRTVLEGSPAYKAGMKEGDLVVSVNGTPTEGLSNDAIIALLKEKDNVVLVTERAGVKLNVLMSKAPVYTYDRKCLFGNCIDGRGKAVFVGGELQYEATFIEGEITGPCKIFRADGALIYEGLVSARVPNGVGKKYVETADRKTVLVSEGTYVDNVLSTGTTYYEDGRIESSGTYDKYNRLINGYYSAGYRYNAVYYSCADIRYDADGALILNGPVTVREKKTGNTGRVETEATYVNGKRDGLVKEWDYNEDVRHEIAYTSGIPVSGTVYRIGDGAVVGRDVHYKADAGDVHTVDNITGGTFMFGRQPKVIELKDGKAVYISNIKAMCKEGEAVVIDPLVVPTKITKTETPTNTTPPNNDKHLADFKAEVAVHNLKDEMQAIVNEVKSISDFGKRVKPHTYDADKYLFYDRKEKVIRRINGAIATYRGTVPAGYISELEQMRRKISEDLIFPDR